MSTKQKEYWKRYNRWAPVYAGAAISGIFVVLFWAIGMPMEIHGFAITNDSVGNFLERYPIMWVLVIIVGISFLCSIVVAIRGILLWTKSLKKKAHDI
jgi:hypothetical protein